VSKETVRRAAQEYLAERLSEEGLTYEETQNRDAAIALAPALWKKVRETVAGMAKEWNEVTKEQSLTYKETPLGDLRIRCVGRPHQLTIHFDSPRRLIEFENTNRPDHEPKVILSIEGYASDTGRGARLMRNREVVNLEMLILRQLRQLAGLSRQR